MARVSIGLPVYNGENFLEDAIRSVLSQSMGDLELVICDNASTDRTESICRDYAASDARVLYSRNPRNLGAAPNYNRTFQLASGELFKWLSHDDRLLPGYLAATVAALDAAPEAILAHTVVDYIDARGAVFARYDSRLDQAVALAESALWGFPTPQETERIVESLSREEIERAWRRAVFGGGVWATLE